MAKIAIICYDLNEDRAIAMNVSLTPRLEAFVREKVASGLYNNASEVVRDALRLMVEKHDVKPADTPARGKDAVLTTLRAQKAALGKRGVTALHLFSSVARGEARPGSDVDVLIDLDPRHRFGLLDLAGVKSVLEDALGRPVDVITREGLAKNLRAKVSAEAERVF